MAVIKPGYNKISDEIVTGPERLTIFHKNPMNNKIYPNSDVGKKIAEEANKIVGCKFEYGSIGPATFDNTGLIYYCHKKSGVKVPRTASELSKSGKSVDTGSAQAGDVYMMAKQFSRATPLFSIVTSVDNGVINVIGIYTTGQVVKKGRASPIKPIAYLLTMNYIKILRFW